MMTLFTPGLCMYLEFVIIMTIIAQTPDFQRTFNNEELGLLGILFEFIKLFVLILICT